MGHWSDHFYWTSYSNNEELLRSTYQILSHWKADQHSNPVYLRTPVCSLSDCNDYGYLLEKAVLWDDALSSAYWHIRKGIRLRSKLDLECHLALLYLDFDLYQHGPYLPNGNPWSCQVPLSLLHYLGLSRLRFGKRHGDKGLILQPQRRAWPSQLCLLRQNWNTHSKRYGVQEVLGRSHLLWKLKPW